MALQTFSTLNRPNISKKKAELIFRHNKMSIYSVSRELKILPSRFLVQSTPNVWMKTNMMRWIKMSSRWWIQTFNNLSIKPLILNNNNSNRRIQKKNLRNPLREVRSKRTPYSCSSSSNSYNNSCWRLANRRKENNILRNWREQIIMESFKAWTMWSRSLPHRPIKTSSVRVLKLIKLRRKSVWWICPQMWQIALNSLSSYQTSHQIFQTHPTAAKIMLLIQIMRWPLSFRNQRMVQKQRIRSQWIITHHL